LPSLAAPLRLHFKTSKAPRGPGIALCVLLSNSVFAAPQSATAAYGLAAVFAWGTSDFLGGYFTRRLNVFLFTAVFNLGGLILMGTLAGTSHVPLPSSRSIIWALAGGVTGSIGVAIFFRALSTGKMGLAAPVAAVLGAAIPALFSFFVEGPPGMVPLAGFGLAGIGLWLITRVEDGGAPQNIGLAVLAGIGFAGFYLCLRQAGAGSVLWFASLTRTGGLIITGFVALLLGSFRKISAADAARATLTGCIDSLGTVLYVLASQSGRLDEAVVISSLYPAVTVLLARIVLKEHLTRWRFIGLLAALAAVPMIAAG
jgi:drug/metabolite transporter (DMT)-like permease